MDSPASLSFDRQLQPHGSLASEEYWRSLWARHEVRTKIAGVKRFDHPLIGQLELDYESFTVSGAHHQQLIVYHPDPATRHAQNLAQQNEGYSPIKTGVAFLPLSGTIMITAVIGSTVLAPRIGPKVLVSLGMLLSGIGMALFTRIGLHDQDPQVDRDRGQRVGMMTPPR